MKKSFKSPCWRSLVQPFAVAVVAWPLVVGAQVTWPVLSGPSTGKVAQEVKVNGAGLVPNSAVSVVVLAPGAPEAHFSAVVGADGTLTYRLVPQAGGQHVFKVVDSSGKELASARVIVAP